MRTGLRVALAALALSSALPVCSSSFLRDVTAAVASGLPRITVQRALLADAAPVLATPSASQEGNQHLRAGATNGLPEVIDHLQIRNDAAVAASGIGDEVLRVHPIKGDGRCLFRAIAQSLAHVENRPLNEHYQTKDADALRKAAMYVICNEKREAFESAKVIEGDMKTYCKNMNSPNFFGGEPELFVLAEELRRPIAVYVPQGGGFKAIVEYGAKYARERSRIRVLYNGQNHYDALLD